MLLERKDEGYQYRGGFYWQEFINIWGDVAVQTKFKGTYRKSFVFTESSEECSIKEPSCGANGKLKVYKIQI